MQRVVESRVSCETGDTKPAPRQRRGLLLVTPENIVPECLIHAIEREFPWITVEQVDNLAAACVPFRQPVNLILVDASFANAIDDFAAELSRYHASAFIALLHDDSRRPLSVQEAFASRSVRGVLPMSLKLDVWLSVIRLMLHGGEYLPVALLQQFAPTESKKNTVRSVENGRPEFARGASPGIENELTGREVQVLELVSRGLQNKVIASSLRLSENTVKIHLHNIITKLGVHNRTQAADIFRGRRDASFSATEGSGSSRSPDPYVM